MHHVLEYFFSGWMHVSELLQNMLLDDACQKLIVFDALCRFGNPSCSSLNQVNLEVVSHGPGPLTHWWHHGPDNTLCLAYSAQKSGKDPC